ncbi:MAG: hypothetical protein ACJAZM_001556 [Cyclobacteriaceae bacterium]|jgi:hypothetical protein
MTEKIVSSNTHDSISAQAYFDLTQSFAAEGKTSGEQQTDALIHYSKLNARRSKRISKTVTLDEETIKSIANISTPQRWIIITETWCGDAANSIPVFHKMAALNDAIEIKILFRDENIAMMDRFLTNGGRSIPKVIAIDSNDEVIATWGPRPAAAQEIYTGWKNAENPGPYEAVHVTLQKWYNEDKGTSTQQEWIKLLQGQR